MNATLEQKHNWPILAMAWVMVFTASDLLNILWHFIAPEPTWLVWAKLTGLFIMFIMVLMIDRLRPQSRFAIILLFVYLAPYFSGWINNAIWWQNYFGKQQTAFVFGQFGIQLSELIAMGSILALMWIIKGKGHAFFISIGQLNAPLEPVRWLGIRQGETWNRFGWIFAACFGGGTIVFMNATSLPLLNKISQAISLFPYLVLFAALNSLGEELTYRAPLLATSHEVVGFQPSLWMTSIFFGLAHYLYGDPSGWIGFLLTAFVAYILGKSMLETRGIFWAWFIHFIADVPIFILYGLKSI